MTHGIGLGWRAGGHAGDAGNLPAWVPSMRGMLVFGLAGMSAGLWLDAGHLGVAWLAVWCGRADPWTWQSVRLHWQELPAMHVGMLLGGLAAFALRGAGRAGVRPSMAGLGCNLFCGAFMALGMDAGAVLLRTPVPAGWQALLAMVAGMVVGMLASLWAIRIGHALWRVSVGAGG